MIHAQPTDPQDERKSDYTTEAPTVKPRCDLCHHWTQQGQVAGTCRKRNWGTIASYGRDCDLFKAAKIPS